MNSIYFIFAKLITVQLFASCHNCSHDGPPAEKMLPIITQDDIAETAPISAVQFQEDEMTTIMEADMSHKLDDSNDQSDQASTSGGSSKSITPCNDLGTLIQKANGSWETVKELLRKLSNERKSSFLPCIVNQALRRFYIPTL